MKQYIDKAAVVAEIKRYKHKADERLKIKNRPLSEDLKDSALQNLCGNLIHFIDTIEVKEVDLTNIKAEWSPSKKQIESLKDLLEYNIGVFDYQKFMEVNSLYDDLTKILDYETDRQR